MDNKNSNGLIIGGILIILIVLYFVLSPCSNNEVNKDQVTINEAVRTLLYIPLYHAQEQGYFKDEGLEVNIVTGGTATSSFASMLSGEADFSQADPMYVPISREKGSKTKIVAQVVGRIAVWGLTNDPSIAEMDKSTIIGKTISTQQKPMTAYTYTIKLINDLGLIPDKDVKVIEVKPPNEITPFLNKDANFTLTLEPNTSIAESKGGKVILSYPELLGDQIFTALMTTEEFISKNPETVEKVVRAYQRALDDLHNNPENGFETAKKYFPQLDDQVLRNALNRIVSEEVIPKSVNVSKESWDKAIQVRIDAGDLKGYVPMEEAIWEE